MPSQSIQSIDNVNLTHESALSYANIYVLTRYRIVKA
jgi:hypothetical protein